MNNFISTASLIYAVQLHANTKTQGYKSLTLRNYKHHLIIFCDKYIDILSRLGVDYQCDEQTNGQNFDSNSAF